MQAEGLRPTSLRVDGGMVANDWMLQFMADVLDMEVLRPELLGCWKKAVQKVLA